MKQLATLVLLLVATGGLAHAQFTRYIVRLTDKKGSAYSISNPSASLSAKSIARRTKQQRAIDSTDLPVSPAYIQSIRNVPFVTVVNNSKWLNQVLIKITDKTQVANALAAINA